ncbi:MAG: glycosyltransferase family 9 protein [Planctomycetota bacterium]
MTEIKKILIIRLSAVGDVINTLPVLRLLRKHYPQSYIGWAVEEKAKDLLDGDPDINELIVGSWKHDLLPTIPGSNSLHSNCQCIVFRRARHALAPGNIFGAVPEFIKALRRTGYDVALDFQGNLKSGLVSYLSKAKERIGFAPPASKEYNYLFNNQTVSLPEPHINRIEKNLYLLRALGIYETGLPKDSIIDISGLTSVDPLAGRPADRLVIIHPGTSAFGAYKRWAPDRYGQLADRLISELKCQVLLSWGPGEKPLVEQIAAGMKSKPIILDYSQSLKQLAVLLSKATLFIGSDSAPLHLANILRRPLIGLYGPKDPVVYGPWPNRPDAVVIRKELECSPCAKRACDSPVKGPEPKCMELITVDDVFAAAKGLL